MKSLYVRLAWDAALAVCSLTMAFAQDLAPRAYVITPTHSNAVNLTYSYFDGGLNFNGTVPITGATGTYSVPVVSYYHSFNFFGRSANVTASLPYGVGTFQGAVLGTQTQVYRSGLLDSGYRLSVNLKGGPAMQMKEFVKWRQKVLLGVSLRVIAPTGQYDSHQTHQLGHQPVGFQAGVRLLAALGQMGARRIRGSVVLHDEQRLLCGSYPGATDPDAGRLVRRPFEPRLRQAKILGVA